MSAQWVGEIGALMEYPLLHYLLRTGSYQICPHPKFLLKAFSKFHINQPIHLPVFLSKPDLDNQKALLHILDVRRALAFYLDRTKSFRTTHKLFVSVADRSKGSAISNQRLSKWRSACINSCYKSFNIQTPLNIYTHSFRSIFTSMAFLKHVPIIEIRKAATCSLNTML